MTEKSFLGCPRCLVSERKAVTTEAILNPEDSTTLYNGEYASINTHLQSSDGNAVSHVYLPIYSIQVYVEIFGAVAFIYVKSIFMNTTGRTVAGIFTFPAISDPVTTISSCDISFGNSTFSTILVDSDDAKFKSDPELSDVLEETFSDVSTQSLLGPKSFKMPFHSCNNNTEIIVDLRYTQDLILNPKTGHYELVVPLFVPPSQPIYNNFDIKSIVSIICKLTPGNLSAAKFECQSSTHDMKTLSVAETAITVKCESKERTNTDFVISYCPLSEDISASCIVQPYSKQEEGTFMVFLSPPMATKAKTIPRNIVSLIIP